MKNNKINGLAKWIIVAIAVGGIIFNTAILYNDVKHQQKYAEESRRIEERHYEELKQEVRDLRNYLMDK